MELIEAYKLGYSDLDFPEVTEEFCVYIRNLLNGNFSFVLDLTNCVITYSQTSLILNLFLEHFTIPIDQEKKHFEIITTDNYVTKELTCYQFFRTTQIISTDSNTPANVTNDVDSFCNKNNLIIRIRVIPDIGTNGKSKTFDFGDIKC